MTRARGLVGGLVLLVTAGPLASPAADAATTAYRIQAVQSTSSEPVRWNPCTPITYRINPNGYAGSTAVSRVRTALAEVSTATGIRFSYLGTTTVVPDDVTNPTVGVADVVIAWARSGTGPRRSAMLPSDSRVVGIGGYAARPTNTGFLVARRGYVVFNAGHVFTMSARRQYVVALHELGHLVGLGDVSNAYEVMNSTVLTNGPSHYATGDLLGLRRVGRGAGCLVPPSVPRTPTAARSGNRVSVSTAAVTSLSGAVTYTLTSTELGVLAKSSTPTFSVSLATLADRGYAGRTLTLRVRAANKVGSVTSGSVSYRVPSAVLTRTPSLVATPTTLDVLAPAAVLAGTTVDVTDKLTVTATGTVGVYKERGLTYTGTLFQHMLFSGLPIWTYDVLGSVAVRGPGLSRTFDVSGSYRTSAWQPPPPPPEPTPSPEPPPTP